VVTGDAVGKKSTDYRSRIEEEHSGKCGESILSEQSHHLVRNNTQNENDSLTSKFKRKLAIYQNDGFLYSPSL
jgi:hypothetical protein